MDKPTRPRSEPEIIPPGQGPEIWQGRDAGNVSRVYVKQVGPLGAILLTLGIGAAAVIAIFLLLGTAIIGLAAIGALVLAGAIAGILRGPPRAR